MELNNSRIIKVDNKSTSIAEKRNRPRPASNGMQVEFFKHNVGREELESVKAVADSLFLTTGEVVDRFEANLASYLGVKYAVGLTSCTGALHLSLLAAGVGAGDEVITTPMSFVATANAIGMAGARPVFVDVEPETGNIDANLIEEAITPKTKAILPVHLYGQMVDMKKILVIAKKHNLKVVEDAAHALEAKRDRIRPGTRSFAACFSFYATKSITSGEGGAVVTQDEKTAKKIRQLRSHGITAEAAQRHRTGVKTYDVDDLGWKYNMDNIQAALLLPQLARVEAVWKRRHEVAEYYRQAFERAGIEMPSAGAGKHAHHLFPIWVSPRKRNAVLSAINSAGIGAQINYPPIHLFTLYRNLGWKKGMFPRAEKIGASAISLPLYAKLTDAEVEYVTDTVTRIVKES